MFCSTVTSLMISAFMKALEHTLMISDGHALSIYTSLRDGAFYGDTLLHLVKEMRELRELVEH